MLQLMDTIESALKVDEFRTEATKLSLNLFYTNQMYKQKLNRDLVKYKLTIAQYYVLEILYRQHPNSLSIHHIRDEIYEPTLDLSRLIGKLVKNEYVEKKVSEYDKRLVDIMLTNKGLKLLKDPKIMPFDKYIQDKFTEAELLVFNQFLDKLRTF
jgi:DNA-binding MarR family transcriptional regulator